MKSYSLQICRVIKLLEKSVMVIMTTTERESVIAIMATTDLKKRGYIKYTPLQIALH